MTRNALTARFLDELARRQLPADELPSVAWGSFDLAAASYEGRCLTRPAFLEQSEWARLERQLDNLLKALAELPHRQFGGDVGAFARALGMSDRQVAAVTQAGDQPLTRLGRADLYHDGTGFRLMELNLGSATGGLDTAMLSRAFLTHPMMAEFAEANRLSYRDTLAEMVATLRAECAVPAGRRPLVAAVDLPAAFATLEPQLRHSAAALAPFGLDVVPAHLGQLKIDGGQVWLDDRPVDVIYRIFLLEDLNTPADAELIEPVLAAVARGEVAMFTPIGSELYGSKAALAMLSDEAHRHQDRPAALTELDELLPWTRLVREGMVTVDGAQVELLDYALAQREELVLKPASLHGGAGVVLGWQVDEPQWRRHLTEAMGRPYVLQRRIRGVPELFPGPDGLQPWLLRWGVFSVSSGYGGATVIGTRDVTGGVVNMASGATATAGCCFHAQAD